MNAVENHLIDLLPAADRNRILVLCEAVELVLSEVLCEPGKLTRHVYFPTQGYISLVTSGRRQLGRGSGHGRP